MDQQIKLYSILAVGSLIVFIGFQTWKYFSPEFYRRYGIIVASLLFMSFVFSCIIIRILLKIKELENKM